MIELAICDDHALIREGLIRILAYEKDLKIVIESDCGIDLIEKMKSKQPDIVLLDMNMDKMGGIDALKYIKKTWKDVKVIMLTVEKQKRKIKEAMKCGADGYVLKESAGNEITKAIDAVYNNNNYVDNLLLKDNFRDNFIETKNSKLEGLSPRELCILIKISEGKKNKQIAKELFLSEKTVKNYVTNVFKKIEVKDRVQATLFAIDNKAKDYFDDMQVTGL